MAIRNDYSAGNASVAAGGTTVTFAGGANITAADISAGDTFKVQNLDAVIATVTDSTHVELAEPWTGTTLASAPYRIRYQPDGSRYSAATRDLIDQLGNGNVLALSGLTGSLGKIPRFTGAAAMDLVDQNDLIQGIQTDEKVETLAERAAFDTAAEGTSVLVADVGDGRAAIYFKLSATSGDWSDPAYLTGPNGTFQSKGTYSGATAYVVGDVVLQNGSSWIARVNTTGNPPPTLPTTSNTQWFLLAAAGSGFLFRGDYSGATAYLKDDVVVNQNSTWIALVSTTGNAPPTLPTTSNTQWKALAVRGAGDFSGPASSTTDSLVLFNDTTGKVGKDSGLSVASVMRGALGATDNVLLRSDGTGGVSAQGSLATLTDAGRLTLPAQPAFECSFQGFAAGSFVMAFADLLNRGGHSSGAIFTAPVAGVYFFYLNYLAGTAASCAVELVKNSGTTLCSGRTNANTFEHTSVQHTVALAAGDTVRPFVRTGQTHTGEAFNRFGGFLVG